MISANVEREILTITWKCRHAITYCEKPSIIKEKKTLDFYGNEIATTTPLLQREGSISKLNN
jgi:hypothetical protein